MEHVRRIALRKRVPKTTTYFRITTQVLNERKINRIYNQFLYIIRKSCIRIEFYNTMAGEGDPELDDEHAYSQDPEKLTRNVTTINGGNESSLNLFETIKLTYSSDTPLVGGKYLNSKAFYEGIRANV
jgi:hypothetical protein